MRCVVPKLDMCVVLKMALHCLQGTKTAYRQPMFRTNTHRDPPDILDPVFDKCTLPLVWWPWWPFNAGQPLSPLVSFFTP